MAQWNSYGQYWQNNAYPTYYDYVQPAQTFDYNHQTTNSSFVPEKPATPPPPGVDSKAVSVVSTSATLYESTWSSTTAFQPQQYPCAYPFPMTPSYTSPRQPVMLRFNTQRPALQGQYPPYGPPQLPHVQPQNQPVNWNTGENGYTYANTSNAVQHPDYWTAPPSTVPSGFGLSGPRYPFHCEMISQNNLTLPTNDAHVDSFTSDNAKELLKQPPASLQAKGTKEQWSDDLKDYVQRAFCSIDTSEEKDQMERILKEKLEYIFRNNIQMDWKTENIPTIPSRAIAGFRNSLASRSNSVSVVRPIQLPTPRGLRPTGPARGSFNRLPVGLLTRGGRNVFSPSSNVSPKKKSQSRSRSRSRSPPSKTVRNWQRKRPHHSRSPKFSLSPKSRDSRHSSSSSDRSPLPRRRYESHSRSRSASRQPSRKSNETKDFEPSPPQVRGGRRNRRRKRGCLTNSNTNSDTVSKTEDTLVQRGRGRGSWRGKRVGANSNSTTATESRLSQRANRFKDHLSESSISGPGSIARTTSQLLLSYGDDRDDLVADFAGCQIVGTMQEIEKQYLRLTRAPDPSEVRPLSILKQSLEHVKQKWCSNTDYRWICEQFKSIRQDLTVQGVEDDFAVSVYEAHADAALEAGDFEEFHQCQSQLLRLHKEGFGVARLLEFTAYRLLYYMFTLDILGINTIMAGLRPAHKSNPCIEFALKLRSVWSLNNYHQFFRLVCPSAEQPQPPLRCKLVVNWFIDRERREAIKILFKVFRPTLSLSFIASSVGFSSTDLCKEFICKEFSLNEEFFSVPEKIDCKAVWSIMCTQTT